MVYRKATGAHATTGGLAHIRTEQKRAVNKLAHRLRKLSELCPVRKPHVLYSTCTNIHVHVLATEQ